MKNYVIVAPVYEPTSAGICALHHLSQQINERGYPSRVLTPGHGGSVSDHEIVLYPDCFSGNFYHAKNVVRCLFMFAGYFGQDKDFPESEYMYYYSPDFILNGRNPDNILSVPVVNEARFQYQPEGRSGSCYLAIKYKGFKGNVPYDIPEGCIEINKIMDLGALFKTVKKLITFDNSAINLEAAHCGIEVEYRFNPTFEKPFSFGPDFDYNDVLASYQRLKKKYFEEQLPQFIKRTQERFA